MIPRVGLQLTVQEINERVAEIARVTTTSSKYLKARASGSIKDCVNHGASATLQKKLYKPDNRDRTYDGLLEDIMWVIIAQ